MRLILGPFPGHVTPDTAIVLAGTEPSTEEAGAPLVLRSRSAAGGPASEVPLVTRAAAGGTGTALALLAGGPDAEHHLEVLAPDGRPLAALRLRSAPLPSGSGRIAFAFGSCFSPRMPDPGATWRDLASLALARHVDHLLLLGDQAYPDDPRGPLAPDRPLPAEALDIYRRAFREAWSQEDLRRAWSLLPSTCTWDDHEIANGWGSEEWHRRSPEGIARFDAVARAFDELQAARNPPPLVAGSRAHAFRRGPAAFLALDLRSHRDAGRGVLLGEAQARAVHDWLAGEGRDAPVLFVACSVPLVHLPPVRAWGGLRRVSDITDQWSSEANREERSWLLERLLAVEDAGTRVVLLGGDVHVATAATLERPDGRVTWQLSASPFAQSLPRYVRPALALAGDTFRARAGDVTLRARILRRWHGRNFGVVRGEVEGGRSRLAFEVYRPGRRTERVELT